MNQSLSFPATGLKKIRPRKCKWCREKFVPERQMQQCCGWNCALSYSAQEKEKKAKRETKAKLIELKPLQYWLKRAEKAVNALRRAEDLAAGYGCITCGTHDAEEWHAGHWISVGASSATRFDPANIHLQCRQCNYFGGGKAQDYEARLPARIGQAEVDRLKAAKRERKWTREECQAIEAEALVKLRELRVRT